MLRIRQYHVVWDESGINELLELVGLKNNRARNKKAVKQY